MHKLTEEKVAELRRRVRQGESMWALALEVGFSHSTVWKAVRGGSWRQVKEEPPVLTSEVIQEAPPASATRGLVEEDVKAARRAYLQGDALWLIADRLGVDPDTLYQAVRGASWASLLDPPPVKVPRGNRGYQKGQVQARKIGKSGNCYITLPEVEALRRAVHAGAKVSDAWRDLGLADRGLTYQTALDATRNPNRHKTCPVPPVLRVKTATPGSPVLEG